MRRFIYNYTIALNSGEVLTTVRFKKQNLTKQYPDAVSITVETVPNTTGYSSFHKLNADNKRKFAKDWRKALKKGRVWILE